MKQIHKDYHQPFLLEKTKLDRLMDVIHERLGEHKDTIISDDFEVFLSGQRREEMTSLADVVKLDNARKSKIQRLLIKCCASSARAARPEHDIHVDFDGRSADKSKTTVIISVRSDNAGWSDRALSGVEEQVERTWLRDMSHRVALATLGVALTCWLVFLLLPMFTSSSNFILGDADRMWLRGNDVAWAQKIAQQNRTMTDEEMRELYTKQVRNVLKGIENNQPSGWTRQKSFIGGPLAVVLACTIYLLAVCYPKAVFLWGDEIDRYQKMLQLRRIIWGIIISLTLVGVLSKILVMGLLPGP